MRCLPSFHSSFSLSICFLHHPLLPPFPHPLSLSLHFTLHATLSEPSTHSASSIHPFFFLYVCTNALPPFLSVSLFPIRSHHPTLLARLQPSPPPTLLPSLLPSPSSFPGHCARFHLSLAFHFIVRSYQRGGFLNRYGMFSHTRVFFRPHESLPPSFQPGAVYVSQTLRFLAPIFVGEEVQAHVEVIGVMPHKHRYK